MIRNALIAIYILAVLAFSAVSRAEVPVVVEPNRSERFVTMTVDPLPGFDKCESHTTKMLSFGNSGVKF